MNTSYTTDSISSSLRQHHDLWKVVNCYVKLHKHLMYLAQGVSQHEGVVHWARVEEAFTDIALYMSRYHRGIELPSPNTIERDPGYAEELVDSIAQHAYSQERDLLGQMLDLIYWMYDQREFHQPTGQSNATIIVTWSLCQKLDDLATYCDLRVLQKVRADSATQLRIATETDAGRFMQARLRKDPTEGEIALWNAPVGRWCYGGVSLGSLLIDIAFVPEFLQRVRHWTELRPRESEEMDNKKEV